jgi:outer membrane protein assembly factor BamA
MGKYNLNVRISQQERQILDQYCAAVERTQSDVIREFIRSLEGKVRKSQDVK